MRFGTVNGDASRALVLAAACIVRRPDSLPSRVLPELPWFRHMRSVRKRILQRPRVSAEVLSVRRVLGLCLQRVEFIGSDSHNGGTTAAAAITTAAAAATATTAASKKRMLTVIGDIPL